jgi:hypothetical protein
MDPSPDKELEPPMMVPCQLLKIEPFKEEQSGQHQENLPETSKNNFKKLEEVITKINSWKGHKYKEIKKVRILDKKMTQTAAKK